jgi:hypothetical protein
MHDLDKIKSKIKKLLALSKSPNPNEAASALQIAQALMAEYKVNYADASHIEIDSNLTNTVYRNRPPRYEEILFLDIASAFGCVVLYSGNWDKRYWRFIGLKHRSEVSAYIGQVLLRKLKTARSNYYKKLYRVRSKYRKIQRADDFCLAWVSAVTEKLSAFAGISEEEQNAIDVYVNKNHPALTKLNSIRRSFGNDVDFFNGHTAGARIKLQHGVGVDPRKTLLLST